MRTSVPAITAAVALALSTGIGVRAQDTGQSAAPKTAAVPLKVQIVITRFQGDKKVSSLPYTLSLVANDPRGTGSSLRMGAQVPIAPRTGPDSKDVANNQLQYRDIGTNIDCSATTLDEGRFRVGITIDDSSVIGDEPAAQQGLASGRPWFRSFRSTEVLLLKDGQSAQYTTVTDKVNGEVVKVDMTLTVLK